MFKLIRHTKVMKQFISLTKTLKTTPQCLNRLKSTQSVYLIDDTNSSGEITPEINKYTNRTFTCGQLSAENIGETVTLCGWLEHCRMNKFLVLRDSYGHTQLLIDEKANEIRQLLDHLPLESIIQATGTVLSRPVQQQNRKQPTGEVELAVESLKVLNKANEHLPFNIREFQRAKEALRMQYRYLDLRFSQMQRNLRVRSEVVGKMRRFLTDQAGFVDVETPTLFRATPGGAQEFKVPTRFPGEFYALVQSPQQFKQMLMAGAVDRYFQIARCYRDEGARPDRQPEFTQLDVELSFTSREAIFELIEDLLNFCWPAFLGGLPKRFARMTFRDAMRDYGSDQPDVRFGNLIQDCSGLFTDEKADFGAFAVAFSRKHLVLSKQLKDKLAQLANNYPKTKLLQIKAKTKRDFVAKAGKVFTESKALEIGDKLQLNDESLVFLAHGDKADSLALLGKVRTDYADGVEAVGLEIRKKGSHLVWIYDFPLFELKAGARRLEAAHHPFTAPHPDDLRLLEAHPARVRSLSFDLVLNGSEIGGGSMRVHEPDLQKRLLEMLEIDLDEMRHVVDMLGSGCPPHGGIALGLDRLMAKILGMGSIRDVIAFPKTFEGRDPLSGAPSTISDEDKKLYHIQTLD